MIGGGFYFYGCVDKLPNSMPDGCIVHWRGEEYVYANNEPLQMSNFTTKAETDVFPKICERCCAPLKSCECEYCGTRYAC